MKHPRSRQENPGRRTSSGDGRASEAGIEHDRLARLAEPYTPERRQLPRWLLWGALATAIVVVLGVAFASGTSLLARYAAKSIAPVEHPAAQIGPDDPAALARPSPRSSADPASGAPPARRADR
jgi:hypothetical protein